MKVTVITDARFSVTPDGQAWTSTALPYSFWTRYLDAFDAVNIVARGERVAGPGPTGTPVSGPNVSLTALPHYIGPAEYLRVRASVRRAMALAVGADDAVILRAASTLCNEIAPKLIAANRRFAVEVIGDPYDMFARGSVVHPLRPIFRAWHCRWLRTLCWQASAASYVTETALQRRYPPNPGAFTAHYSSIELDETALAVSAPTPRPAPWTVVTVASLAQQSKGVDTLLEAIASLVRQGLPVHLRVIGEGRHRAGLEATAVRLGVAHRVSFLGAISSGAPLRAELDRADVFALPSRCEGLPRAAIEAMARGLPVIGSTVGGFAELLSPSFMVPPNAPQLLASKLQRLLCSPGERASAGAMNLERAKAYTDASLRPRRRVFYENLRALSETPRRTVGKVP